MLYIVSNNLHNIKKKKNRLQHIIYKCLHNVYEKNAAFKCKDFQIFYLTHTTNILNVVVISQ